MRKFINSLQDKPEHKRKQILFVSLGVSMFIVFLVFMYSVFGRFSSNESEVATKEDSLKPFRLFTESAKDAYKNITASVGSAPSLEQPKTPDNILPLITVEQE
jgi:flagellar basal body-associated protein FliL